MRTGPVIACNDTGCNSYMCADLSQQCAVSCGGCKKVFCEDHVSEYDECECILCPECRKGRVRTCKTCSEVYTHFCDGCANYRFMDCGVMESLEKWNWKSSGKCMMCFLDVIK